jgi:hypothetical protein
VIWDPAIAAFCLPVHAIAASGEPLFRAASYGLAWRFVVSGPEQHLLLRDRGASLQLQGFGASLLEPVRLFAAVEDGRSRVRRQALAALSDLLGSGRFSAGRFPADPRSRRLSAVLRALDGNLAGLSVREIAILLFGEARVAADWSGGTGHLRDQVRRAVARGLYLMRQGYRALLR